MQSNLAVLTLLACILEVQYSSLGQHNYSNWSFSGFFLPGIHQDSTSNYATTYFFHIFFKTVLLQAPNAIIK